MDSMTTVDEFVVNCSSIPLIRRTIPKIHDIFNVRVGFGDVYVDLHKTVKVKTGRRKKKSPQSDEQPSDNIRKQWVILEGKTEDRKNAKEYIICVCYPEDETVVQSPAVLQMVEDDPQILERIERDTRAVVTRDTSSGNIRISGSELAVTLALSTFEDFIMESVSDNDEDCSTSKSPGSLSNASSRLDMCLKQSLLQNSDGMVTPEDYANTPDCIKRIMIQSLSDIDKTRSLPQINSGITKNKSIVNKQTLVPTSLVTKFLPVDSDVPTPAVETGDNIIDVDNTRVPVLSNNNESEEMDTSEGISDPVQNSTSHFNKLREIAKRSNYSDEDIDACLNDPDFSRSNQSVTSFLKRLFLMEKASPVGAAKRDGKDTTVNLDETVPEVSTDMHGGTVHEEDTVSEDRKDTAVHLDETVPEVATDLQGATAHEEDTVSCAKGKNSPEELTVVNKTRKLQSGSTAENLSAQSTLEQDDDTTVMCLDRDVNNSPSPLTEWPVDVVNGSKSNKEIAEYLSQLAQDFQEESVTSSIEDLKERNNKRKVILARCLNERLKERESDASKTSGSLKCEKNKNVPKKETSMTSQTKKKGRRRSRNKEKGKSSPKTTDIIDLTSNLSVSEICISDDNTANEICISDDNNTLTEIYISDDNSCTMDANSDKEETMVMAVWKPDWNKNCSTKSPSPQSHAVSSGIKTTSSYVLTKSTSSSVEPKSQSNSNLQDHSLKPSTTAQRESGFHTAPFRSTGFSLIPTNINTVSDSKLPRFRSMVPSSTVYSHAYGKVKPCHVPVSSASDDSKNLRSNLEFLAASDIPVPLNSTSGSNAKNLQANLAVMASASIQKNPVDMESDDLSVEVLPGPSISVHASSSSASDAKNLQANLAVMATASFQQNPVDMESDDVAVEVLPGPSLSVNALPGSASDAKNLQSNLEFMAASIHLDAADILTDEASSEIPPRTSLPASYWREPRPTKPQSRFRYIVIDGSNVAMAHGNNRVFSCYGIVLCVQYFLTRGHQEITVFVPQWRKRAPTRANPIADQKLILQLETDGYLVFTPSRRLEDGRSISCYDDRYVLNLAVAKDGIVVSNDNYRDLIDEKVEFRRVITERLLMFSFVDDMFMPPDDPLGKYGPTLSQFLLKPIQPARKRVHSPSVVNTQPPPHRATSYLPLSTPTTFLPNQALPTQPFPNKVQKVQPPFRTLEQTRVLKNSLLSIFPDHVKKIESILRNHPHETDINKMSNYLMCILE